jgi:hypothetical protein
MTSPINDSKKIMTSKKKAEMLLLLPSYLTD